MVTYGPDLNLSCAELGPAELVDVGRKLTHYSPWLVPLSFSSPFRDGRPWGGLSARTDVRTGARPAVLVFLDADQPQVDADPSLTQVARIPAEVGRIEFKAFDACPDPTLYGELLSLLTGLVLDRTLPGRRTTPDAAAHRHVARVGLADDAVHAGTGRAARRGRQPRWPAGTTTWPGWPRLRARWERRECPADGDARRVSRGAARGRPARADAAVLNTAASEGSAVGVLGVRVAAAAHVVAEPPGRVQQDRRPGRRTA